MEDENRKSRDEMRATVIEAMVEAFTEWLPRDAKIEDVFYIAGAATLGLLVRASESDEQAVALCRGLGESLAKLSVEDAHDIRVSYALAEAALATLPEGEDR